MLRHNFACAVLQKSFLDYRKTDASITSSEMTMKLHESACFQPQEKPHAVPKVSGGEMASSIIVPKPFLAPRRANSSFWL